MNTGRCRNSTFGSLIRYLRILELKDSPLTTESYAYLPPALLVAGSPPECVFD